MGTPAQPDLIENVGKINPPHCGHIRPPLLGMLVGGVRSGRGLRQRTDRRHDFCRHGAIRYLHWRKRINVARLLAGRVARGSARHERQACQRQTGHFGCSCHIRDLGWGVGTSVHLSLVGLARRFLAGLN